MLLRWFWMPFEIQGLGFKISKCCFCISFSRFLKNLMQNRFFSQIAMPSIHLLRLNYTMMLCCSSDWMICVTKNAMENASAGVFSKIWFLRFPKWAPPRCLFQTSFLWLLILNICLQLPWRTRGPGGYAIPLRSDADGAFLGGTVSFANHHCAPWRSHRRVYLSQCVSFVRCWRV